MPRYYLVLLGLVVFLGGPGCQPTPGRSLCADFDCSGHGTCVVTALGSESVPTCVCDSGFDPSPSGWLCLPSSDSSLCAGVTCSGHGSCVSVKGQARCLCDSGYQVADDGQDCLDPCKGVSCSGHGTCHADADGPRCTCAPGYLPTVDGTGCELAGGAYLIYQVESEGHWTSGRIMVDLSRLDEGVIDETVRYSVYYSWSRRIARAARQSWTLDASGLEVTAHEVDDALVQGEVSHRRWAKATFDKDTLSATFQRLDKLATVSRSFSSSRRPVPMLGGFEYPGWALGCSSPAFYAMALSRYVPGAKDPQLLDVFWPSSSTVSQIRVEAGPGWTPQEPVLRFPDYQVEVTYEAGFPKSIVDEGMELTWVRYAGAPADLNLEPIDPGTPLATTPLPSDGTESAVSFTSADGTQLAGTLTLPKNPSNAPAVLMVSDLWGQDRNVPLMYLPQPLYQHLAAHLAQAGFASLRYDPRGRGLSKGDASRATLEELVQDALAAHKALSQSPVDSSRVFLLSHNTGATVALSLLDPQHNLAVKGYVALAPVINEIEKQAIYRGTEHLKVAGFSNNYLKQLQQSYYSDPLQEIVDGSYVPEDFLGIPVTLWQDLLPFDGSTLLGAYPGPVLVLWGDQDLEVPPEQLQAAQDAATTANKTNLEAQTLAGLASMLVPGSKPDLLEEALLPLDLSVTGSGLTPILTWLDANK